jgi:threonine dehydratase
VTTQPATTEPVTLDDVRQAAARITGHARRTPVLTTGIGTAIGTERTLVAVEPENCDCLPVAFAAGAPADAPAEGVAASALGASRVGELAFAILSSWTPS